MITMHSVEIQYDNTIKAGALDIDGTITDGRRRLVLDCVEAMRELESCGIRCILISGNVLPVAMGIGSGIGVSGPIVGENGGMMFYKDKVYKLADGEEAQQACEHLMSSTDAKDLVTNRWRKVEMGVLPDIPIEKVKKVVSDYNVNVESTGFAHHLFGRTPTRPQYYCASFQNATTTYASFYPV